MNVIYVILPNKCMYIIIQYRSFVAKFTVQQCSPAYLASVDDGAVVGEIESFVTKQSVAAVAPVSPLPRALLD